MEDLRVIKTKTAIIEAFLTLVETRDYASVKISDIAKEAKINRNTFYLHYASKEELMTQILEESLQMHLKDFPFSKALQHFGRKELTRFFLGVLDAMEENIELYRIYLLDEEMMGYFRVRVQKAKNDVFGGIRKESNFSYEEEFLFSGILGVLSSWVTLAAGDKEEVAKRIVDMSYDPVRKLLFTYRAKGLLVKPKKAA